MNVQTQTQQPVFQTNRFSVVYTYLASTAFNQALVFSPIVALTRSG